MQIKDAYWIPCVNSCSEFAMKMETNGAVTLGLAWLAWRGSEMFACFWQVVSCGIESFTTKCPFTQRTITVIILVHINAEHWCFYCKFVLLFCRLSRDLSAPWRWKKSSKRDSNDIQLCHYHYSHGVDFAFMALISNLQRKCIHIYDSIEFKVFFVAFYSRSVLGICMLAKVSDPSWL